MGDGYGEKTGQGEVSGLRLSGAQIQSQWTDEGEHCEAGQDGDRQDSAEAGNQEDHSGWPGVLGTGRCGDGWGGRDRAETGGTQAEDSAGDREAYGDSGERAGTEAAGDVRQGNSGI